jgi:hypothetical protein
MPIPFAPLAVFIVLFRAMLPPIREVIEAGIEHSPWDVQGCWGIVEDVWLKTVEGVGMGKGLQGVLLLPSCVVIQLLEVGQVLGQISNPVMGVSEVLYFSAEGFISLLLDGEVNHQGECRPQEEGVCFFAGEDSSGIWVFPCPEWARVTGAVAPP